MTDEPMLNLVTSKAQELNRELVKALVSKVPMPPAQRKLTQREQLDRYLSMTDQDMAGFIQQYGEVKTNYYIGKMEQLRARMGR